MSTNPTMTPPTTYRIAEKAPEFPCWVWEPEITIHGSKFPAGWVFLEDDPLNPEMRSLAATYWCHGQESERPTHDPTAPAAQANTNSSQISNKLVVGTTQEGPPAWAVEAAEEIGRYSSCALLFTEQWYKRTSHIIAKHAPATPATSAAKGGDIPRTPTDSEMLDWLGNKHRSLHAFYTETNLPLWTADGDVGHLTPRAAIAAAMKGGAR